MTAHLSISNEYEFQSFSMPRKESILGVKFSNPIPRKGNEKFHVLGRFELYNWALNLLKFNTQKMGLENFHLPCRFKH